jgi:predicted metal-dependent hydrolase
VIGCYYAYGKLAAMSIISKDGRRYLRLPDKDLQYLIRRNRRAKNIIIKMPAGENSLLVVLPFLVPSSVADNFVISQIAKIVAWQEKEANCRAVSPGGSRVDYLQHREGARIYIKKRLDEFCFNYGFAYKSLSVRNQKTRWASCSARGHLSFNYKIMFLPAAWADYVIIHELCHTRELNHSDRFGD